MQANVPSSQPQLSLNEMLRVMDVATELRKQRESVEQELAIDETKQMLRDRLLAATTITGERVSESEVDTAIAQYYSTLYTYHEPPASFNLRLAQAYVRRGQIALTLVLVLALAGAGWFMLRSTAGTFSKTLRQSRRSIQQATSARDLSSKMQANAKAHATELTTTVSSMLDQMRAAAREASVTQELERLAGELNLARDQFDVKSLTNLKQHLSGLLGQLNEAYEVHIVSGPNEKSGIDRYFEDEEGKRVSGYYVIVEARDPAGKPLTRRIRNAESGDVESVNRWAERVPVEDQSRQESRWRSGRDPFRHQATRLSTRRSQTRGARRPTADSPRTNHEVVSPQMW
jgi:Family of unknown function (DUF6384)